MRRDRPNLSILFLERVRQYRDGGLCFRADFGKKLLSQQIPVP